jgi:hydroxymethylpyrimidine/phosphomethylpyrimidine kinase
MRIALTIAGSDASGGAGIQADLKTFQAHGVFGMSAITAVTVQNTQKVYDIQEVRPAVVHDQIMRVFEDTAVDVIKIGMVSSIELIEAIADALTQLSPPPIILDPVMISKSGDALLKPDAQKALITHLFPLAEAVTPNLYEAELLARIKIKTIEDMKQAAMNMIENGAKKTVIKGGHLDGDVARDLVYDGSTQRELTAPKIDSKNTHGTGCTFSSALAANIALGKDFFTAADAAKKYITEAIRTAPDIGHGSGPLNHMVVI